VNLLADFLQGQPLRRAGECALQAFDRLAGRLAAELEGPMMDGEDEVRTRIVRHLQSLFGRAVRANPGIIRADRHDGEIQTPCGAEPAKGSRERCVAAEYDAIARRFNQVAVESPYVSERIRAPQ